VPSERSGFWAKFGPNSGLTHCAQCLADTKLPRLCVRARRRVGCPRAGYALAAKAAQSQAI